MTETTATAPGKIILCGEYAVLSGAPAVVMAVDRRASVRIVHHSEDWCAVETPGLADGLRRFDIKRGGNIRWLDESAAVGLPVLETVIEQTAFAPSAPVHITIDTCALFDRESGQKLGLGSSAAATAALTRAMCGPGADRVDVWNRARRAHAAMQGGSGVDIAASCFGGLLCFQQDSDTPPARLEWPASLACQVFFSGVPASTRNAISSAGTPDASWDALTTAAADAASAWQVGDPAGILASLYNYCRQLRDFDQMMATQIFSAGHAELCAEGEKLDVVYKPSGAGGGDCGIALATDVAQLAAFARVAAAHGFVPLDIGRDNSGL